jgi:hypothetical protein
MTPDLPIISHPMTGKHNLSIRLRRCSPGKIPCGCRFKRKRRIKTHKISVLCPPFSDFQIPTSDFCYLSSACRGVARRAKTGPLTSDLIRYTLRSALCSKFFRLPHSDFRILISTISASNPGTTASGPRHWPDAAIIWLPDAGAGCLRPVCLHPAVQIPRHSVRWACRPFASTR